MESGLEFPGFVCHWQWGGDSTDQIPGNEISRETFKKGGSVSLERRHPSRIVCIGWDCSCSEHRLIPWCPGADTTPAALLCWVLCDCSGKQDTVRVRLVKVLLYWNSVFLILLLRTHFPVNFTVFFTSSVINVLNPVFEKTQEKEWNPSSLKWTNTGVKKKKGKILPLKVSTRIYLSFMLKTVWGASPLVERSPVPTAWCHPCVGTWREVLQAKNWPPATQCGMSLMSSRRTESQPQLHPSL